MGKGLGLIYRERYKILERLFFEHFSRANARKIMIEQGMEKNTFESLWRRLANGEVIKKYAI